MKRKKPGHNQAADLSSESNESSMGMGLNMNRTLFGGIKLSWIVYGAAAYYGLKMLSKRGYFPASTDEARDLVSRGINTVKQQVGMNTSADTAAPNY